MRRLDIYILRQLATPLVFALVVFTAIVWLTQSLQRLELVVENGESWGTFAVLSLLLIPNLLGVILPFALFGATLFALNKLHSDSEIAVIFAAGISRLRIAAPVLLIAFLTALASLWIAIDLMPRSYRELKREIADIRADLASAVLRSGEFVPFGEGFTVYVEEALKNGQFRGILINDYRNGESPETYMAQYGKLEETASGPVLFLLNGNIQTISETTGKVDFVNFDRTAVNLSGLTERSGDLQLELTERYLGELLFPDMTDQWDREHAGALIAEGHSRLAAPAYPISYAIIALYALVGGSYSRRGYALRIALACLVVGGMRVAGFMIQGGAAETGNYWLIYAVPLVPAVLLFLGLADVLPRWRLRPMPAALEAT